MSARITFLEPLAAPSSGGTGVLVPRAAVRGDPGAPFAWTVVDAHVRRTPLTLGKDFGDRVQVTSGLSGGETLVTGTPPPLREGQKVKTAQR
jgi:multidrug efflux pump subunit AcrA (membrane-fusion protein)